MVCRVSEPLNAERMSRVRRAIVIAAAALLLLVSGGAVVWWNWAGDVTCASGAVLACGEGECCEGQPGPREPEDPETVQFTDATDLTAGAPAFTATDGYLALAAPGVWVPDLEREGWTRIPDEELVDAQFGFTSGDVRVDCYGPGERTVPINDFLIDDDVFSAIAVAQRARSDEASVYERTTAPVFGHYRIDGNAVLAGEAGYTWTSRVDPDTGEITEGEWIERWGFVAVYLGSAGVAVCSYGGPDSAEAFDEVQDRLLGIRLAD